MTDAYVADPYAQYLQPQSAPPSAPVAPATPSVVPQILAAEGTGQNPRSSAAGPGQFIDSTWKDMIGKYRPDLAYGKTPDQIIAMKTDPQYAPVAKAMTNAYAAENSEALSNAGFQPTPGNVYLAHFAGPQGATGVLKADPNTPVSQVLGSKVVAANPFLANMTTGQLQQWAASRVADRPEGFYGGRMHVNISRPAGTAPAKPNDDPYAVYAQGGNPEAAGGISTTNAAITGALQGMTGNFFDEMQGAKAASGVPDIFGGAFQIPVGAARLAYEHATGQPGEASKAYDEAVQKIRAYQQQAAEQHPIASALGNVGGALATAALPVGGMAAGASLPARMAAGAASGGAYGALYGAGEGSGIEDRATRAASGGVIGAATGGVAPAVLAGVGGAARGIASHTGALLGHPIDTFRALRNTDQEAARRIGTAIIGDMQSGRGGMTAADLTAARSSGQPAAVIDVGGEGTRALGRSAANTSPGARSALEDLTQNRFTSQGQRAIQFIRNLIPTGGNAVRTQEQLEQAARIANKGAYTRAYAAGNREIDSPELQRLAGSPDVADAMKDATSKGKSRAIADGLTAPTPNTKNIQFWDYTYRSLRDSANAAFRAGRNDEGSYLSSLSKQLRSEIDTHVPEYAAARSGAAKYFGAEDALEAGQKFVSMRGDINEARQAIAKMSGPERALFAEGFVSELTNRISKISDNRSLTIDRIFNSQDGKARIAAAIGPGRAAELEMFLRREGMMDAARKMLGGSTTARQWAEIGIAGGVGAGAQAAITGDFSPKTILTGALVSATVAGHQSINFKLAQRIGEMLASSDPKVLQTALRMASNNPTVGNAMRRAETLIEKLAGQGAGNAPPILPVAGISRADQQQ